MRNAAPTWAATASKLSMHHRSRDSDPEAAYAVSSMPAIAATLRAHAAASVRDHDSTAPAPELPAVRATTKSNIHSTLSAPTDQNQTRPAALWMNQRPCAQRRRQARICRRSMLFGGPTAELRGERPGADHQAARPLGDLGVGERATDLQRHHHRLPAVVVEDGCGDDADVVTLLRSPRAGRLAGEVDP